MKKQVELSITHNGKDVVTYPYTKKEHVQFENGMNIDEFVGQDIATPTITHDTTAIKVGVGDSDVSSSVVDSAVNMTIKGQTYQNILPEPTLRNEMQGKSMQRLNEGYDSIETVDGVSKSAILKGQTLVNGLSNPIIKMGGEYVTTISPTHLVINHGENTLGKRVSVNYEWLGGKMRDGADYTLDIWILKNTMRRKDDPTAKIGKINFNNYDTGYYSIPTGKTGHIVYEVTTPTTSTTEGPYIETFTTCEGELEIQMVIREGKNLIPIEQHFEGMASCKMPIFKNVGKNLFNPKTASVVGAKKQDIQNIVSLQSNTTYTFYANGRTWVGAKLYDGNDIQTRVVGQTQTDKLVTFTTTSSEVKAILLYHSGRENNVIENVDFTNVQFEVGQKNTKYEPYKTSILTTPEQVVLRKVGDVCDSYDALTGEYIQRIGEYIITGNEGWYTNAQNNCQRFAFQCVDMSIIKNNGYSDSKIYINCDKLAGVIWSNSWNTLNTITTNNGFVYFHLPLETTTEQAKAKMVGTKLQYVLETPITTIIEPSTIPFIYENGHTLLESGYEGQSLLPTLEYSTVINRTGQIQSIANTVQKQEKQITKLEKMLVQNIIDIEYKNTLLALKLEIDEVI